MLSASTLKCFVIHNPVAGKSRHGLADKVLSLLAAEGAELHVERTTAPGHAKQLAGDGGNFDRVIAVGGDGTINEVINGLAVLDAAPPLAIIPAGTSNVLAAEIGLPRAAAALTEVVRSGVPTPICLGMVNGRYFSLMAGVGFDAHMIANTSMRLKKRIGGAAYAASFFRQLFDFRFADYQLTMDGNTLTVGSAIVSNVQRYAPQWVIAPGARLTMAQLHVCHVAAPVSRVSKTVPMKLFGGKWAIGRGLSIDVASSITIEGPAGEPVQADGEIVTSLPATIGTVPNALRIMFPR